MAALTRSSISWFVGVGLLLKEQTGSNVPLMQPPTEVQGYRIAGTTLLPTRRSPKAPL